jgi:hypothetical protein
MSTPQRPEPKPIKGYPDRMQVGVLGTRPAGAAGG